MTTTEHLTGTAITRLAEAGIAWRPYADTQRTGILLTLAPTIDEPARLDPSHAVHVLLDLDGLRLVAETAPAIAADAAAPLVLPTFPTAIPREVTLTATGLIWTTPGSPVIHRVPLTPSLLADLATHLDGEARVLALLLSRR